MDNSKRPIGHIRVHDQNPPYRNGDNQPAPRQSSRPVSNSGFKSSRSTTPTSRGVNSDVSSAHNPGLKAPSSGVPHSHVPSASGSRLAQSARNPKPVHVETEGSTPNSYMYSRSDASKYNHQQARGHAQNFYTGPVRPVRSSQKSKSPKQIAWLVVLIICILVLLASGGVLIAMTHGYHSGTKTYDMIAHDAIINQETDDLACMSIDWEGLAQKNPDVIAWVYIPGTDINYPIVQGEDDNEYLRQNFMREDSLLVHKGTIFLSEKNNRSLSDDASYFFGHNMNDDTMFGPIMGFFEQSTFDSHRDVYILTPYMNYRCETFALRLVPSTELSIIQPDLRGEGRMESYINQQISSADVASLQEFDATSIDKIFSFITCGDDYANTRAVLFAGVVESAVPLQSGTIIADEKSDSVVDSKVDNG